jgi:hypothetical protein
MKVFKTHFCPSVNSMRVTQANQDPTLHNMKVISSLNNPKMVISKLDRLLSIIANLPTLYQSLATCLSSLRSVNIANCAHNVIIGEKKQRCTTKKLKNI